MVQTWYTYDCCCFIVYKNTCGCFGSQACTVSLPYLPLSSLLSSGPVTLICEPFAGQIFSFQSNCHRVSRGATCLSLPSPRFCYCCSRNARILLVSARQWSVLSVIAGLRMNGWPRYGRTRTASSSSSAERVIRTCTYRSSSESWDAPSVGGIWLYRSSLGATAMARRWVYDNCEARGCWCWACGMPHVG